MFLFYLCVLYQKRGAQEFPICVSVNYSVISVSYLDLDSAHRKTSLYYYFRVIGEVCGGKRVHLGSVHCWDHPLAQPCILWGARQELASSSVALKAVSTQGWHTAGLAAATRAAGAACPSSQALLPPSVLSVELVLVPLPAGIPETWLAAATDKHLISWAGFLALTASNLVIFKLFQFLYAFFSSFDFHVCVGLCLRVNRSENVLNKHKQGWNKWQPSTCSSLNNPYIYFGNIFILILFPVLISI